MSRLNALDDRLMIRSQVKDDADAESACTMIPTQRDVDISGFPFLARSTHTFTHHTLASRLYHPSISLFLSSCLR